MRLPNSYGSVYKIKDGKRLNSQGKLVPVRRRCPWVARITDGWKVAESSGKAYPKYKFIGYYKTRSEALQALDDFKHSDKVDLKRVTFKETYETWSEKKFQDIKDNRHYISAFKCSAPIHNRAMCDLVFPEMQSLIDAQKTHTATKHMKILIVALFEYGYLQGTVSADMKERVKYLDIDHCVEAQKNEHKPFTHEEIRGLWEKEGITRDIVLVLIYTGLRISELQNLKMDDVHLKERYFSITDAKTAAGIRDVPIYEKIVPIIKSIAGKTYMLEPHVSYNSFINSNWKTGMKKLGLSHTPHDTRHTCATLLEEAGIDDRIVKSILGHKRNDITGTYSHIGINAKLEAINKL